MGVGNQTTRVTPTASTNHKIYNKLSHTVSEQEFSQALTNGTKQLIIRTRESYDLKFSFVSGESKTKYITIPKNATYKVENVDLQNKVLYKI